MRVCDARQLKRGDCVVWNDPDSGLCSRAFTLSAVTVSGDMVSLEDKDGDYLECPAGEIELDR